MSTASSSQARGGHRVGPAGMMILCLLLCAASPAEVPQAAEKAGESGLPLPRWTEQELKTFRESLPQINSPGVLLPANGGSTADINELIRTPLPSSPRLDHFFNGQEGELSARLRAEDMRLFLPESILGQPVHPEPSNVQLPTPVASLREVSSEFLAACYQSLAKEYLIDPNQLIPEIQNHDMMRLLEFHAHDARIKLFVLILGHDQTLPDNAQLEKIASGSLMQTDACLAVYPLGEPWRTRLFVSRSIHNQISTGFLSDTIQACLREALQSSNAHDQLRSYTVQLSTRLFWLQKALGPENSHEGGKGEPLDEFNPMAKAPVARSGTFAVSGVIWTAATLLALWVAGMVFRRLRHSLRLRKQGRVWMLPEPETIPRLGGAFTGGGGGMIRYG
ncbi:hypothetical protein [Prosthecobacter sp.]|uniref:hypothetical protein n=1 Tax=Prosthecobacter sp. TaxID=1965333 RepID=UPI0037840A25